MAAALAEKLNQCAVKITTANIESNAASCFSGWLSIHQLLREYFLVSAGAEQSEEVRESQERFDWKWPELPEFPLHKLMRLAGKTLAQCSHEIAHPLLIADFCVDACKQNVLAKTSAMESGVVQGLCRVAGHMAAIINLPPGVLNETVLKRSELLMYRVFEALHSITETPTVGFYSKSIEVKREFYRKAEKAWGEVDIGEFIPQLSVALNLPPSTDVNHALFLTVFCLKQMPGHESNEHYLSVLRNIAEPWGFKFPTQNRAFLKLPYCTRAMNHFASGLTYVAQPDDVRKWSQYREVMTRKEVRDEALRIQVEWQSGEVPERPDVDQSSFDSVQPSSVFGTDPQQAAAAIQDLLDWVNRVRPGDRSSMRAESQPSESAGHGGSVNGNHGRAAESSARSVASEKKNESQEKAPDRDGQVRNDRKGIEESQADAGVTRKNEARGREKAQEAENSEKDAQGHESASRERGDARTGRAGDRVCGWCAKKQKERAEGAPKFKKCGRCEGVFYCNAECQKLHWSQHKQACARP